MKDFKLDSVAGIKSGFIAPDAYFDTLADQLAARLPQRDAKVVPLYRRRPVWVTSAAAVFVVSVTLMLDKKEPKAAAVPDIAAIEDYLMYQTDISAYDIQQNLDAGDVKELAEESIVISDEAIEEYLAGENIYLYE